MSEPSLGHYLQLFTEIGIIEQLSRALLEAQLPHGFIQPHFAVLNHLIRGQDGATPQGLARAFQVPKNSMTHTLRGLAQAGLIEMRPNPTDGRSKCIWITQAGRRFHRQAVEAVAADLTGFAKVFPPERLVTLVPLLQEIRSILDRQRAEGFSQDADEKR